MRWLAILGLLLFTGRANAVIAFVNGSTGASQTCDTNTGNWTFTTTTGNTEIIIVSWTETNSVPAESVSTITDTGGSTYTFRVGYNSPDHSGQSVREELWSTEAGGLVGSTSTTVTLTGTVKSFGGCAAQYSGVTALGGLVATSVEDGADSTMTLSLVTLDSNNWMVGGFGRAATNPTPTYTTGTRRVAKVGGTSCGGNRSNTSLGDNTTASAGSTLSIVASDSTSNAGVGVGMELRTSTSADTYTQTDTPTETETPTETDTETETVTDTATVTATATATATSGAATATPTRTPPPGLFRHGDPHNHGKPNVLHSQASPVQTRDPMYAWTGRRW